MSTVITNVSGGVFSIDNYVWKKGEVKTINEPLSQEIIDALELGTNITSTTDYTPFADLDAVDNDLAEITDSSTGTAATETDGALTIAVVDDVAAAADAVATIAVELAKQKAINTALVTHITAMEAAITRIGLDLSVLADK